MNKSVIMETTLSQKVNQTDNQKVIIYNDNTPGIVMWELEIPFKFAKICKMFEMFLNTNEHIIRIPIQDYEKETLQHLVDIYNIHSTFPTKETFIEVLKEIKQHMDDIKNPNKNPPTDTTIILARNERNDKYVEAIHTYVMKYVPENPKNNGKELDKYDIPSEQDKYLLPENMLKLSSYINCEEITIILALIHSNWVRDEITPRETFGLPEYDEKEDIPELAAALAAEASIIADDNDDDPDNEDEDGDNDDN